MLHRTPRLLLLAMAVSIVADTVPAGAQTSRTHKVAITGFKFVPAVLNVRVGDRVEFTNTDVVPHTATRRPDGWDTGTLKKDQSWTMEIAAVGKHDYFCRFHPNMMAEIIVQ